VKGYILCGNGAIHLRGKVLFLVTDIYLGFIIFARYRHKFSFLVCVFEHENFLEQKKSLVLTLGFVYEHKCRTKNHT